MDNDVTESLLPQHGGNAASTSSQGGAALSAPEGKTDEAKQLEHLLRKERIKARWLVRERATIYLDRYFRAKECAISLRGVPFSTRLVEAPNSLRESLVMLTARLLMFNLSVGWALSPSVSPSYRRCLIQWSKRFLEHCLVVLELECSPSLSQVFGFLKSLRSADSKCFFSDETKEEIFNDLRNPEPIKRNFLALCDLFLQAECIAAFEQNKLFKPERACTVSSAPASPKSQKPPDSTWDTAAPFPGESSMKADSDNRIYSWPDLLIRHCATSNESETPQAVDEAAFNIVLHQESSSTISAPFIAAVVLRDFLMLFILSNYYDAKVYAIFDKLAACSTMWIIFHLQIVLFFGCPSLVIDYKYSRKSASMRQDCRESSRSKHVRRLKVAGVAAGLGALTAITAGLAAPAIAAGFGALGIAGTSGAVSFLASVGGSATVASVFGAGTVGLSGWKYSKRIGKIKVFEFDLLSSCGNLTDSVPVPCSREDSSKSSLDEIFDSQHGELYDVSSLSPSVACSAPAEEDNKTIGPALTVTISISGWLRDVTDIWKPWKGMTTGQSDVYALRWDPAVLLDLGNLVTTMLSQKFAVTAAQLWLQTTVAGALTSALMWPVAVIQYAATLDNAWMACKYVCRFCGISVVRERALQAGRLLADALCDRNTVGMRPVTLLGFSMGARVIHACLLELRRREAFNVVADVVLLGTPTTCNKVPWQKAREVVSGRIINCYSRTDWLLGFLFRYMEWGVAGVSSVNVEGVENYDISGIVRSHNQYAERILDVLAFIEYKAEPHQRNLLLHPEGTN